MNQPTEPTIAIDVYRTRRERVLAALRAAGGGVAIVPTAPEALRNRDTDYPVPARQLLLLPDRLHRARGAAGARRERRGRRAGLDPVLPREERRARDLGRLPPRPGRRARRRSASTPPSPSTNSTRSCRACSPTSRRCITRSAPRRNSTHRCAAGSTRCARKARSGVAAPSGRARSRPAARRDAARQGRPRARHHAPRRADQRQAHAARWPLLPGPGVREYELEAELLHEFRKRGAQARPTARSSPPAPMPACCTTAAGTAPRARRRAGA